MSGVAVHEATRGDLNDLLMGEVAVIATDVERLIVHRNHRGVLVAVRYSNPAPGGDRSRRVIKVGDSYEHLLSRVDRAVVGEPLSYAIRGTRVDGRARPMRTAPVREIRLVRLVDAMADDLD